MCHNIGRKLRKIDQPGKVWSRVGVLLNSYFLRLVFVKIGIYILQNASWLPSHSSENNGF